MQSIQIARYENVDSARAALLARRNLEDTGVPESVTARIREVFGEPLSPVQVVERIIDDVRHEGDAALRKYAAQIDGREISEPRVPDEAIERAIEQIPPSLVDALTAAAERVRTFHERARRGSWVHFEGDGATGQIVRPLRRVGIYAPAGRAPYPSSVLMAAIPARVAGVAEVVLASPPGPDGEVVPSLLAAARIAGVDAIYRMGGAQAIAALAYGTESIRRVDKILGPGNLFVALAKRMVYGQVAIEGLAGPTECVLVADDSANPHYLAADLIAQAEHDPLAQPILIATSAYQIDQTLAIAAEMLETAPRAAIIRESMAARGAAILVGSVDEAIKLANDYAPEHLCLCVRDAWSRLGQVENAGGVFVGEMSAESIGDYTAGPSHIMPTGGTARFSSPLNLDDFLKITSVFAFGPVDVERLGPPAIDLARAEGLFAHAEAIEIRLRDIDAHDA
jgi:histidinol dehydrogenase